MNSQREREECHRQRGDYVIMYTGGESLGDDLTEREQREERMAETKTREGQDRFSG